MVIAHSKKAGQWAKQQAQIISSRTFATILIGVFVASAIGGFLSGLTIGRDLPWPLSLLAVVLFAGMIGLA